jgi:F0F1-type ATP synthase membrane subunit a
LGATLLGFNKYGLEFFSLFVPAGCPLTLLPLLVLIEFISSLARNVSLGLRLAANIVAGHLLLNILSGFTYNIITTRVSPPKPYAFVSLPLQSTFYSIFIIKIYKFFLDLLKYLFLSVFKNIRFSTSGSVVSYKGIN